MNDEITDPHMIHLLTSWGKWSKHHPNIGGAGCTIEYRLMNEGGVLISSTNENLDDDPGSENVDKVIAKLPKPHKKILCVRFIYKEGRQMEADKMMLSKAAYKNRLNMAIAWFSGSYDRT